MENLAILQPVLMSGIWDPILSVVGIVVAFGALVIGLYHVYEIRQVMKRGKAQLAASKHLDKEIQKVLGDTKNQLKKLEGLESSTSTHFIREFPDFIPKIVELIKSADENILIFCDIAAYGHFSSHYGWKHYCHAIEDKIEDKRVRGEVFEIDLICLDHHSRLASYDVVLNDWPKWKSVPGHLKKLEEFLLERKHFWIGSHAFSDELLKNKLDALDKDAFKKLLEKANQEMLEGTFSNIQTYKEIKGVMPAFFWLADGRNAIFSIPAYRDEHTELGFSTSDGNLINALLAIRDRYLQPPTDGRSANDPLSPPVNHKH